MSAQPNESIRQILADLHAHRLKTMDPAALKINIDQRQTLVDTANYDGFVKAGDGSNPLFCRTSRVANSAWTACWPMVRRC